MRLERLVGVMHHRDVFDVKSDSPLSRPLSASRRSMCSLPASVKEIWRCFLLSSSSNPAIYDSLLPNSSSPCAFVSSLSILRCSAIRLLDEVVERVVKVGAILDRAGDDERRRAPRRSGSSPPRRRWRRRGTRSTTTGGRRPRLPRRRGSMRARRKVRLPEYGTRSAARRLICRGGPWPRLYPCRGRATPAIFPSHSPLPVGIDDSGTDINRQLRAPRLLWRRKFSRRAGGAWQPTDRLRRQPSWQPLRRVRRHPAGCTSKGPAGRARHHARQAQLHVIARR